MGAGGAVMIEDVSDNTPLRLSDAAALAFPHGGMTASGLRREAAKGRLAVSRIAGKDYTTLAAIREMIETCRVEPKVPVSGCNLHDGTARAGSSKKLCGASEMETTNVALASARAKLRRLKEPLPSTSPASTAPRG
jgi:hypothetical protein